MAKKKRKRNVKNVSAVVAHGQVRRNRGAMRRLRISHTEYVQELKSDGTSEFRGGVPMNPGYQTTFPWLSGIARNFETYVWHKLVIHYHPSCPTSSAGAIALVPDYDPSDDNTNVTKAMLMSHQDTVRGNIWADVSCYCTPSNLRKRRTNYVSTGNVAGRQSNALRLWYFLSGVSASIGGELWIEYDIELQTPQLQEHTAESSAGRTDNSTGSTLPFVDSTQASQLMKLKSSLGYNEVTVKDGQTLNFNEPNKLYALRGLAYDLGSAITNVADWGSAVNGTLAGLTKYITTTGSMAQAEAFFTTDKSVTTDNPASVAWTGGTFSFTPASDYFKVWVDPTTYGWDI